MNPEIGEVQRQVSQGRYEFTIHAQRERLADDLDVLEIEKAIEQGELLEEYSDDPRGWSCQILGYVEGKPVHIVIGWARSRHRGGGVLRVITVYVPKPPRWRDSRTRGEKG
jgi:hypothetical protein